MTPRLVFAIAASASIVATSAPAQSAQPQLPPRLGPAARAAIEATIDSASAAGLPVGSLVDKAAEGVLKGADDARIVAAVRSLAAALRESRDALGPVDPSLLAAGASALRAGVSAQDLRGLARSNDGHMPAADVFATALVTLVDFVSKGVSPAVATKSIDRLLRVDAPASQFVRLRTQVEQDVRSGQSPDAALNARLRDDLRDMDGAPNAATRSPAPPTSDRSDRL